MKEGDVMNLEHPMVTHIRTHGYPKEADREQMRRHGGPAGYPQGGRMGKIVISYSSDRFDQWRLGEAGDSSLLRKTESLYSNSIVKANTNGISD